MRFKIEDVVFRLDVPLDTEVVDAKTYDKREKEYNEAITELSERNHALAAELSEAKSNNSIWHRRAIQDQDQVRNMRFQNVNLRNLNNNLLAEVKRQEARADEAEKLYIDNLRYLKEKVDAISQGKQQESGQPEYKDRKGSGQTTEASNCDSTVSGGQVKAKSEAQKVTGPYNPTNAKRTIFVPGLGEVVAYDPKPFDYQANGGQDANIEKSKESFKGILYYLT